MFIGTIRNWKTISLHRYWLLTIRDQYQTTRKISAKEIFDIRVANSFWVVNEHNRNFHRIKEGDKAIFYQCGSKGKQFLGRCLVSSQPERLTQELKQLITTQPSSLFNHYVSLDDIEVWKNPKLLIPMLNKLSFIRNKHHWGSYLQGGLRNISESDYFTIANSNVS